MFESSCNWNYWKTLLSWRFGLSQRWKCRRSCFYNVRKSSLSKAILNNNQKLKFQCYHVKISFLLSLFAYDFSSKNELLGCLEILEDDDVVVAILSNGDAFGEEIWVRNFAGKSRYYVRALAPTDLRSIKTASLSKVLQFYHQFSESFDQNMVLR